MSSPDTIGAEWLSPTRVWRLTRCPASAGRLHFPPVAECAGPQNSGTIAHTAVQLWIENGGHHSMDPCSALVGSINIALAATGTDPPPDWPVTRARLLIRAAELASLLVGYPHRQVICETELRDPAWKIRGTPDIVLVGDTVAVIDLKTQTLKKSELPPWEQFQLAIYAHLVKQTYGALPKTVEVFSLNRGRIPVVVTPELIADALSKVQQARKASPAEAHPGLETCRFCRRRMECQPHWNAAKGWPDSDCVEGEIKRLEKAANGHIALLLKTPGGPAWVSGIPVKLMSVTTGARIRFVRLRTATSSHYPVAAWKWGTSSALAVR